MDSYEFADHSDSSDEDYVPNTKEDISDIDSDVCSDNEQKEGTEKNGKRTKQSTHAKKKHKIREMKVECKATQEERKKNDDDVWAEFMRDTGFQSRKERLQSSALCKTDQPVSKSSDKNCEIKENKHEKIKITQRFNFAGEDVAVEKEIPKNSREAEVFTKSTPNKSIAGNKDNLSGILSQLGKKTKISTLEKSKLDWDQFKKEENLAEELEAFNKGKDGYLEKQDFLQRADLRRFEIEKEVRTIERNKRMNT